LIAAIDIGGTKIAVGMIDDEGRVLTQQSTPTDAARGYADALSRTLNLLRRVERDANANITGIGIGSTGPVDPLTGEFGDMDFLPGWQGCNIVSYMQQAFNVPVALENDGDASALGEATWGAAKDKPRLIYITVGTGIGGGIILDGHLYRGVDHSHPELGHHVMEATTGPACSCGFRGCWESLAAGPAMSAWLQANATQGYPHKDSPQTEALTTKRICELAREGDTLALQCVAREARYLGLGLANLINCFTPDVIVLGGSVMNSADLFLDGIHKTIREGCRYVPFKKTKLQMASLGPDANLIGAAAVWRHRFAKPA
jgi:glucokinase